MKGYLYILRSLKNARFYIGSTNDVGRRIIEHNRGKSRYTRFAGPFELVYQKEYTTLSEARQAEYQLKRQKSRLVIEKLISGD